MNRLLYTINNLLAQIFKVTYRSLWGIDYKALNQHIMSIHQLQDIDSILYRSSRCLKDILDYQLFAFAMCDDVAVDIWVDPNLQSNDLAILNIIKNDLAVKDGGCTIHHFDDDEIIAKKKYKEIRLEDLLSYRVLDADFKARLYVVPNRNISHYHDDVIDMMMKVVGTSLSHCMRVKRLQQNVMIDPLTLCYNKRALDEFIDQTIDSTKRYGSDLSAIMLDLDHFKNINDTYGHQVGDIVLKAVSCTILSTIRKCDYLIRYGGEEFVLIMPATKLSKAVDVADRLRKIIENLIITNNGTTIRVTASFGVADMKKDYNKYNLLRDADRRLYDAKSKGRNRIAPDLRLFEFENSTVPDIAYQYLN